MGRCEWCGAEGETVEYIDALGERHEICKSCNKTVEDYECRKCGATVDSSMMINGLCTTCMQADLKLKSKKKEEVRQGLGINMYAESTQAEFTQGEFTLTDKDYESWLTFGNCFSPSDMSNIELKRLWIMVKLNAAGIYEPDIIAKHFSNIENLLDRNFTKLVGNKCRLIIADIAERRKEIRDADVLDYEGEVYIVMI